MPVFPQFKDRPIDMLCHLGVHQVEAHAAQALDDVEDQFHVVQAVQRRDVIDHRLAASRIPETGDLPSFATVTADQCRAYHPVDYVIAGCILDQCHACSNVDLADIVIAASRSLLYKFDRITQL
jgi:hypothetical protein